MIIKPDYNSSPKCIYCQKNLAEPAFEDELEYYKVIGQIYGERFINEEVRAKFPVCHKCSEKRFNKLALSLLFLSVPIGLILAFCFLPEEAGLFVKFMLGWVGGWLLGVILFSFIALISPKNKDSLLEKHPIAQTLIKHGFSKIQNTGAREWNVQEKGEKASIEWKNDKARLLSDLLDIKGFKVYDD